MKKNLFALLLFSVSLVAFAQENSETTPLDTNKISYDAPKTYQIAGISVSGTQYLNHDLLIDNSALKIGQYISIPGEEIADAIKRLWKLGLFENIEVKLEKVENFNDPSNRQAWLNINLMERPRVADVTFAGITESEKEELKDDLNLIKGKPITKSLKLSINKIIRDYFAHKGFLNAQSSFDEIKDTVNLNSSYLLIDVKKGHRVKISNIVFAGNENVPTHKLKKVMKGTKEKTLVRPVRPSDVNNLKEIKLKKVVNKLPYITLDDVKAFADNRINFQLFSGSKYIKKEFDNDKKEMIRLYNSKGYRDAEVTFDTTYTADAKNIIVKANIAEGRKYFFGDITFKGNTKYSDEVLNSIVGIKYGDVYDESLLEARTTRDEGGRDISSLYMDDGYLFFRAVPVEKSITEDTVDVEIFVNEGKQASIGQVIIKGNEKTHEHVIRRELYTVPGNQFSRREIIASTQRIASMGFFDETQIGVSPINIDERTGNVDLEYTVVEKSNDQVQMQFGYGGERVGLVGQLGLTLTNFSANKIFKKGAWRPLPTGDAQRLSISAALNSLTYKTFSFSFHEPWLGGKRANSLSTSFFKQDYNFFRNPFNPIREEKIGEQNTTGFDFSWGKELNIPDREFIYSAGVSFQTYDLLNSNVFLFPTGSSTNFAITQSFGRDDIGYSFFPRRGSRVIISGKFTPPYSTWRDRNKYVLTDAEANLRVAEETAQRVENYPDPDNTTETLYPLLEDDDPQIISYPTELVVRKRDFITNEENAKKYELVEYHKWRFDGEWYQQLGKNSGFVLRPYIKMGYLGAYNEDLLGFSPFERFRFGGDGLSQGISTFGTTIISQRGYNDDDDYPNNRFGGYPIFNKYGLELRYSLSGEGSTPIYTLLFLEGGNAWESFDEFDPFNIKRSAGLGLRLQLPFFGLIGFDYGIGFDKNLPSGSGLGDRSQFNLILGVQPE